MDRPESRTRNPVKPLQLGRFRALRGAALAAGGLALCFGLTASRAGAQTGEQITDYDTAITMNRDNSIDVVETIDYDFSGSYHHGIERRIPLRYPVQASAVPNAESGAEYERVYPISDISVSSSTPGTPTDLDVTTVSTGVNLRIGDPNETITGTHRYVIRYRLEGPYNGFPDEDELYINLSGGEWDVPIARFTASVTSPGAISRVKCFAGPISSKDPCGGAEKSGSVARFEANQLAVGDAFTVVVGVPKGVLATPKPIYETKWSLRRAFSTGVGQIGTGVGLLGLGVAGLSMLGMRVGRDRRFVGSATDQAFGNDSGEEEVLPLFDKEPVTVEFSPPDRLAPGLVGTIIDERADPVDVTATIVDLAVRGYLRIEELPGEGRWQSTDYKLVLLKSDTSELEVYEQRLMAHLFSTAPEVTVSSLARKFRTQLAEVQSDLYRAVVDRGWFRRRPDTVRARWQMIGVLVVAAGIGAVWLAAKYTTWGIAALPLPILGLVLMVAAHRMPARTGAGTAITRRVIGFREMFYAGEGERQAWAEEQNLFSRYLPYAIVFGCADRWAHTFAALAAAGAVPNDNIGWWVSPRPFDVIILSHSLNNFSTDAAGQLSRVAESTSASGGSGFGGGGFSGGGFGGGGGGSW